MSKTVISQYPEEAHCISNALFVVVLEKCFLLKRIGYFNSEWTLSFVTLQIFFYSQQQRYTLSWKSEKA